MIVTSKIFLLCFLLESFQSFSQCRCLPEGINQTSFTGRVPKNSRLHLLLFQLVQLYNRQIKGSKVPLPIPHGCVCAQPFLAVFSRNCLSFLDDSEAKVRNSICGSREKGLS